MPRISVHIVTYNSATTIESCLQALLHQQSADFDACVIDNASQDETVNLVRRFDVPLIVNPHNIGYAAAHNQAIDQSTSDYVLTLNPDVQLQPGFLAAMIAALDSQPQVGSAAACLLRVEQLGEKPQTIDGTGLYMRRSRRQGLKNEGLPADQRPQQRQPIFGPDGAAAVYRRAMLDDIRVNGEVFDTDFFMHKEDVDVCWRAQLRGWESLYVPQAVAHHVRGFRPGQRDRVSQEMRFLGLRNRYLLMLKNERLLHFLRDLPWIATYDLGILAYVLLRERKSLAAYRSLFALRRQMLAKRRIIQSQRKVDWRTMASRFRL
ncbi:MAG: glycosyltransferase family 2 protein [Anaerolineae bacterium]|nr:glycosyltransferase family 2 protein [Anaerolineae bacterium]